MAKLLKKQKEILQEVVKGKGYFKTPTVPKDHSEKILDDLVNLYLNCLLYTSPSPRDVP